MQLHNASKFKGKKKIPEGIKRKGKGEKKKRKKKKKDYVSMQISVPK